MNVTCLSLAKVEYIILGPVKYVYTVRFVFLHLSQEILQQVVEQGVKFSQKDYTNALTLLANSSPKYPEEKLKKELEQLDTLFSQDAV